MAGTDVLLTGFFGTSDRGFLGWSGLYLVTTPSGRRPAANCRGNEESVFGTRSEGQTTDRIGMIVIDLQRMLRSRICPLSNSWNRTSSAVFYSVAHFRPSN
jgi:hypothetical protein